jgi:hypothetical protein
MVYTLFKPSEDQQYLTQHVHSTPSILFRAHSPRTSGITTATYVASTAAIHREDQGEPYDDDVFDKPRNVARDTLKTHVKKWNRGKEDNFMSWTSSLLFALQHAIRREASDLYPRSTAQQVKLSILFTSKLPAGCFMPSVALLDAYGAQYHDGMQRNKYHGEYLSQGRLDIPEGAMITITMEELLTSGLYQLYPDFELDTWRLCNRVTELRGKYLRQVHDVTPEEISFARTVAEGCCSESSFRFVLFASLLALKTRTLLDPGLQDVYSNLRHGKASLRSCQQASQ